MTADTELCIINAHNGASWYPKGQERLKNSLIHHGFNWDFEGFDIRPVIRRGADGWAFFNTPRDEGDFYPDFSVKTPYNLKAVAVQHAIKLGYSHIFWLDCSVWPVKDPAPFMDILNTDGYYLWRSGFTLWETCNKRTLEYFGITEEEARIAPDCSTSMFGFNLGNGIASQAVNMWLQAARDGMFEGSRNEIEGHPNGRKFCHRQDQSVMSCVAWKLGIPMHDPGQFSMYANPKGEYPDSVVFVMRGM